MHISRFLLSSVVVLAASAVGVVYQTRRIISLVTITPGSVVVSKSISATTEPSASPSPSAAATPVVVEVDAAVADPKRAIHDAVTSLDDDVSKVTTSDFDSEGISDLYSE